MILPLFHPVLWVFTTDKEKQEEAKNARNLFAEFHQGLAAIRNSFVNFMLFVVTFHRRDWNMKEDTVGHCMIFGDRSGTAKRKKAAGE